MKPTDKRRKILWACLALLAVSYVFRSASNYARVMAYRQQAYRAALAAKQRAATAASTTLLNGEPLAPAEHLAGIWEGRFSGICDLRLELKEDEPGKYTGFSRFSCMGANPFGAGADMSRHMLNLSPDTAILSGTMENRSIHFRVDQTMGADPQGCTLSGLTATYFGTGGLAAEWQKGTCGGGHTLLEKQRQ